MNELFFLAQANFPRAGHSQHSVFWGDAKVPLGVQNQVQYNVVWGFPDFIHLFPTFAM